MRVRSHTLTATTKIGKMRGSLAEGLQHLQQQSAADVFMSQNLGASCDTHTHTYRNACLFEFGCHTGNHFLSTGSNPTDGGGPSNGGEAQSASTKSTRSDRQDDGGRAHLQNSLVLYRKNWSNSLDNTSNKQVHQVDQTWLPPSRIASLACVCVMAACPLLKKKRIQKEPCDSKGHTHTRLPEGRRSFSIKLRTRVRLGEN